MISVVLATHNEEKNLTKCLAAVKSIADEIIIADGESTDKTIDIARSFGAKIINTTNKANFHINKQMAMDKAKGQLVLQLDADEIVDEELSKFIKKIEKKLESNEEIIEKAWYINRKNYFLGTFLKKGGQYPDPVIRLYVNGFARLPQKDVHEQMQVDGLTSTAEGHLLHYANPNFKTYLEKFIRYTTFKATQYRSENLKTNALNSLIYIFVKPTWTFLLMFFRHKGFVDGMAGFVFAFMSGLHHCISYLQYYEMRQKND